MYQRAPLLTDSEAEDEAGGTKRQRDRGVEAKPALQIPPVVEEKIPSEPLKTLLSGDKSPKTFINLHKPSQTSINPSINPP